MKKSILLFTFLVLANQIFFAQKPKNLNAKPIKTAVTKTKSVTKDYIKVKYVPPYDTILETWHQTFKDEKFLENIAGTINSVFKINKPLKMTCRECGEVNAYYDGNAKELIICYDLLQDIFLKYEKYIKNEDSLGQKIGYAFAFILYHEVGHALIDFFDIPLTGKEEDAADYFAFYMLGSNGVEEGVAACIEGAEFFKEMHKEMLSDTTYQRINKEGDVMNVLPFWDEHSFNMQRYYSIYNLLFGSNPQKYEYLYYEGKLGYRRRQNAINEYEKIKRGWTRVLKNYIKWK